MEKENTVLEEINKQVEEIENYTKRISNIRKNISIKKTSKLRFIIIRIINTILITISFALSILFLFNNSIVEQSDKLSVSFFFIGLIIVLIAGSYKMRIKKENVIYEFNKLVEDILNDTINDLDEKARKNNISFNYKKDFIYKEQRDLRHDYLQSDVDARAGSYADDDYGDE